MRWFGVAPPVTQNTQEVRTCYIRMCRRAKGEMLCKGFEHFAKLVFVHSWSMSRSVIVSTVVESLLSVTEDLVV